MRKVCAWCQTEQVPVDGVDDQRISHGICKACRARFSPRAKPVTFRDFLDRLTAPVMLIRSDGRVVTANARARALLRKRLRDVEGPCCGAVIECLNAQSEEGCGRHPRCPGCRLRQAIEDTWSTSSPHEAVPVFSRRQDPEGAGDVRFLTSTEKVGELVVLRLAAA